MFLDELEPIDLLSRAPARDIVASLAAEEEEEEEERTWIELPPGGVFLDELEPIDLLSRAPARDIVASLAADEDRVLWGPVAWKSINV